MASSAASPSSSKSDDERRQDGDRDTRDPAASSSAAAAAAQTHAEWAASMQAYYAAAAAAAGGHPYAWPPPQSVPPMAGCAVPSAAAEGKSKRKTSGGPSGEDSSGSGDGGSEDSSERRDDADEKGLSPAKWRKLGHPDIEGETSQAAAMSEQNPVKAAPNLNIGMDIWSNSTMAAMPSGQVEVNAGTHLRRDKALSQMDERELKRERRKQSNRESARRSRLRKQERPTSFCHPPNYPVTFYGLTNQECEELSQKVTELTAVNSTLMTELDKLKKDCEDMEAENSQLMDEMVQSEGSSVIATLSIKIDTSKDRHGSSSQLNKHTNDDSKG
uniref:BZIP domain-containing protein n=1 Tax=Oryza rufipogon TaxID=4529 RepID=A0A0E0P2W6_ORYRU